jgi:polyisoprenoid-binding protein YceI
MATGAAMPQVSAPVRYTMDARSSRFMVKVGTGGALAKLGHNPTISIADFNGEVDFVPVNIEETRVTVKIHAASMIVTDDMNDKDRAEIQSNMQRDVLETDQFPEIAFESTSLKAERVLEGLYRVQIAGNLTLHGETRRHQMTVQVVFMADKLRASGDFLLRQTDYHIKLFSVGMGAMKIKDELKFTFDLVANKVV